MIRLVLSGFWAALAVMAIGWLASVARRDVSIVDACWGGAVVAAGCGWYIALSRDIPARGWLALALAMIWALRLSVFIVVRNRGRPEDRRYREIRARHEPGFWWRSLYLVFGFQAVLACVVALPLLGALASRAALGVIDFAGVALWTFGFLFETVADQQLLSFQRSASGARGVMNRGLWRYSRHPNYFGEFCLWWGLALIALSGGAWWSALGPALLTLFLLKVSGVALAEQDIARRRPEYRDYMRRTSAFVPRPPAP
jgi:steroid 5-alpha reductase family enzyme